LQLTLFSIKFKETEHFKELPMPGFNVNPYGGGYSASGPSNTLEVRRKHRWVFESLGRGNAPWRPNELLNLQSAARPSFKFNVADKHHNQEVVYYAGKQEWDPITLTWYDIEQNPDISAGLYVWLNTVVDMISIGVQPPSNYKKDAVLKMINGLGTSTESWNMVGTWPETLNWQELDYSANELMTCEASLKYDRAVKTA
jgi:hypothetical protein